MNLKNIRFFIEYTLLAGLGAILRRMPRRTVLLIARYAGDVIFFCIPIRKKITLDHLRRSFPEKDIKEITGIAREVYQNLAMNSLEHLCFPGVSREKLLQVVFFDGEGYKERHLKSAIPEGPQRPEIVRITPINKPLPDTSEPAAPVAPVKLPEPPAKVKASIEKTKTDNKIQIDIHDEQPVLDQQGVPVAWTLQLASFRSEDNAKGLRNQLIKNGYKVFTRKQGDLVKVYVGPEFQKKRLESLKDRLKKDFGLSGIIVRFTTQ